MNWHSWSDFFRMGGYGLYVWGTFVVTTVTFVAELAQLRSRRRRALEDMMESEERE